MSYLKRQILPVITSDFFVLTSAMTAVLWDNSDLSLLT